MSRKLCEQAVPIEELMEDRASKLKEAFDVLDAFIAGRSEYSETKDVEWKSGEFCFYWRPLADKSVTFWNGALGPYQVHEIIGAHTVTLKEADSDEIPQGFAQPVSTRHLVKFRYSRGDSQARVAEDAGERLPGFDEEEE